MMPVFHRLFVPALLALTAAAPALAQTVLSGNHSVDGHLCAGLSCTGSETFHNAAAFKLKAPIVGIYFEDVSGASEPLADWEIRINDIFPGGENFFAIHDPSVGNNVLHIENNAPDNSVYVDTDGNVGLGTSLPMADLHIEDGQGAEIRMHRNTSGGNSNSDWRMIAGTNGFSLDDLGTFSFPFSIASGTPTNTMRMVSSGNIGMGTANPSSALHVRRGDGTASIHVQNFSGPGGIVREMFKMSNPGGSYFTLDNTQSNTQWFFVHEDASPNRFIITDGVNDGPEMTLTADGVLTVEGGFVAGATHAQRAALFLCRRLPPASVGRGGAICRNPQPPARCALRRPDYAGRAERH